MSAVKECVHVNDTTGQMRVSTALMDVAEGVYSVIVRERDTATGVAEESVRMVSVG
jgi:hypothetical protein